MIVLRRRGRGHLTHHQIRERNRHHIHEMRRAAYVGRRIGVFINGILGVGLDEQFEVAVQRRRQGDDAAFAVFRARRHETVVREIAQHHIVAVAKNVITRQRHAIRPSRHQSWPGADVLDLPGNGQVSRVANDPVQRRDFGHRQIRVRRERNGDGGGGFIVVGIELAFLEDVAGIGAHDQVKRALDAVGQREGRFAVVRRPGHQRAAVVHRGQQHVISRNRGISG